MTPLPVQTPKQPSHSSGRFTGKHMALVLGGFFGVVIAVNVLLANLAISTFSGVVVENSYVASQEFNGWLGAARADRALGWHAVVGRTPAGMLSFKLTGADGAPLSGASVQAAAEHPLGKRAPVALTAHETAPGVYEAQLEPGRWRLKLEVRAKGQVWHAEKDAM